LKALGLANIPLFDHLLYYPMGGVIVLLHEPCAPTFSSNIATTPLQKCALEHMHVLSNAEIIARMNFLVHAHAIALALASHNLEFGNPPTW